MFQPTPLPRRLSAAVRDAQDPKLAVRLSALSDLTRLAAGAVVEERAVVIDALQRALLRDAEVAVRAAAAEALADAEAAEAVPSLLEALADPSVRVRQMVVLALGEVSPKGHPDVGRAVFAGLRAREPELRFQALIAAARLEAPELGELLFEGLQDADESIRYLALRLLDEHAEAVQLLGAAGPSKRLRTQVAACLQDDAQAVRVAAALLVTRPEGEAAWDCRALACKVLVAGINDNVALPAAADEQALIEAVGELKLDAARPGLARHLRGAFGLVPGRFAFQARVALARCGDPRAIEQLARGLRAFRRDARNLAAMAIGQARLVQLRAQLEQLGDRGAIDAEVASTALALLRDV